MTSSHRIRLAGTAYAVGGVLWFGVLTVVGVLFGLDPSAKSAAYVPTQVLLIIVQLLLLFGFFGVRWSGGVGRDRFGTIAFSLGVLGHLVFVAGEIHSLFIGVNSDLVPLGALTSAVGFLLTGIAVLKAKQWHGWVRWIPLLRSENHRSVQSTVFGARQ